MTRLVQLKKGIVRRVAIVEEPALRVLDGCNSVYELATTAMHEGSRLCDLVQKRRSHERLDYDLVYDGKSEWQLLPPIDHPEERARCMISGTGLTHLGSARERQSMHADARDKMTDSMKMFSWGKEGGRPEPGKLESPQSGSTRAQARLCGRMDRLSKFPGMQGMAVKRRKLPGFT